MFVEMTMDETLLIEGGDFYNGLMTVCKYTFVGSAGVVAGAVGMAGGPVVSVAAGIGAGYVAEKAWDKLFK